MVEETVSHYNYQEFLNGNTLSGSADLDLMEREDNEMPPQLRRDNRRLLYAGGVSLLAGAGLFAISNFGVFPGAWPYLLGAGFAGAGLGAMRLLGRVLRKQTLTFPKLELRRKADRQPNNTILNSFLGQRRKGWGKSSTDKVIMGVCGGLAENSGISPTLIRALWIFAFAITSGVAAFFYLGLGLILPTRSKS